MIEHFSFFIDDLLICCFSAILYLISINLHVKFFILSFYGVKYSFWQNFVSIAIFSTETYQEDEVGANPELRSTDYVASKMLDYFLGDVQPQPDALSVDFFACFEESK